MHLPLLSARVPAHGPVRIALVADVPHGLGLLHGGHELGEIFKALSASNSYSKGMQQHKSDYANFTELGKQP
jgi:hypothetical protein